MCDGENASLRLQFNPKVRLEFHGSNITSDAGLLASREFDDALGLTDIARVGGLVREPPTYNPSRRTSSSAVIVAPLKLLASWSARNLAALTMSSGVAQVETSASGR